ncbi:serine/threonine-protein kinase 36 [Aulostomus maculatus]
MNSYHVLELVGEGSFGRVYKGRKRLTGQVVALKFMPKMGRSDKELQSLKREIDIMGDLEHPNIVKLFDSFETDTEVVVVTEYAEGQLFQILENDGCLPESQVQEIACQLVSALYYLHSHRILHRDMKPQNILLDKNGMVKLCDFGFARAMSISTLVLTSIKGTPLYMSPELVEEKPYDHTADLWALGCILYELHTGAPPFYTNSIFHLVQLIVKDPVKWPDTMSYNCTTFLKGLLTKDPEKRLSWPDLLQHPFVADGVLVLSDTNVCRPLTVTPTPDMLALKLQQAAAKTVLASGQSRLLQKMREKRDHGLSDATTTNQKNQASVTSKQRGQISRDYEKEFPSVEVGPRLKQTRHKVGQVALHMQDVDSEVFWEKLARDSDPSSQQRELLNYGAIIPKLKSNILVLKQQLTGGVVQEEWRIYQPLKALQNLILTSDLETLNHIGSEIGLPHFLFDLVHYSVENSHFFQHPRSVKALGELMVVLLTYWERRHEWVEEEQRLEDLSKPFITILNQTDVSPLAPQLPLPSGWGLCDGLLSLLLHTLWLYSFLSAYLVALTQDPYSCVPLFSESESKFVHALGGLLGTDCLHVLSHRGPRRLDVDLTYDSFSVLSCHLLCFPFALDLPSRAMSRILHLYDSCGVVSGLLQVIQTLPPPQLELPLSLLNRLLLCDPGRSLSRFNKAAHGFFSAPRGGQTSPSSHQTPLVRTASSLLSHLLQLNVLWDSAAELLTLLSLVIRYSPQPSRLHLHLEASVLHQTLAHSYDLIRAAACRLLGNLDPFKSPVVPNLQPNTFKILIDCLHDSCMRVRRIACRAVGNWLGFMVVRAGWGSSSTASEEGRSMTRIEEQKWADGEGRGWIEEARRTTVMLVSLICDPDNLTRHHSCAALGNLVNVDGAVPIVLEKDVTNLLLKAACKDSHHAVRQAAIATMSLYRRHVGPNSEVMR